MSIFTNQSNDQISPTGGINYTGSGSPTTTMLATSGGTFHLYCRQTGGPSGTVMGFNSTPSVSTTSPAGRIVLPNTSAWYVKGQIMVTLGDFTDGSVSANNPVAFDVAFAAAQNTNAASTVLIGTPTITKVFGANNTAVETSSIVITANTTAGSVDITCNGPNSGTVYTWSGFFNFVRAGQ